MYTAEIMIIDGKALAREIMGQLTAEILGLPQVPHLTVFTCAPNFETKKFLALKQKQAAVCGVTLVLHECEPDATLLQIKSAVDAVVSTTDGIVMQFPFPSPLSTTDLVALIPTTHDVDAFSYIGQDTAVLPPVVGAINEIAKTYQVSWMDKSVVVVGSGRLVGAPAAAFARSRGSQVTVLTKDTIDQKTPILQADILILGAGVPGLITADMVKPGVIIFDAGTSEEGGVLVGDACTDVGTKAALVTPVPGGIGPVTIAMLLKNVLYLSQQHRNQRQNVL